MSTDVEFLGWWSTEIEQSIDAAHGSFRSRHPVTVRLYLRASVGTCFVYEITKYDPQNGCCGQVHV